MNMRMDGFAIIFGPPPHPPAPSSTSSGPRMMPPPPLPKRGVLPLWYFYTICYSCLELVVENHAFDMMLVFTFSYSMSFIQ